jgi:hypothetical protein
MDQPRNRKTGRSGKNKMNKSKEIYLTRNRTKRQFKVFTFESMRNAAVEYAKKKYGKASFSLACHMALYKELRANGFINLHKLLTEYKLNRAITALK